MEKVKYDFLHLLFSWDIFRFCQKSFQEINLNGWASAYLFICSLPHYLVCPAPESSVVEICDLYGSDHVWDSAKSPTESVPYFRSTFYILLLGQLLIGDAVVHFGCHFLDENVA